MSLKSKKRRNVEFHLASPHYRKIHLALYGVSLLGIFLVYLFTIVLVDDPFYRNTILVVASVCIGTYLVFNRDRMVKETSDWMITKKRRKIKTSDKKGMKTTLRNITPKNKKLKLDIKGKVTFKERLVKFKQKFSSNNEKEGKKKGPDYIEIED